MGKVEGAVPCAVLCGGTITTEACFVLLCVAVQLSAGFQYTNASTMSARWLATQRILSTSREDPQLTIFSSATSQQSQASRLRGKDQTNLYVL